VGHEAEEQATLRNVAGIHRKVKEYLDMIETFKESKFDKNKNSQVKPS